MTRFARPSLIALSGALLVASAACTQAEQNKAEVDARTAGDKAQTAAAEAGERVEAGAMKAAQAVEKGAANVAGKLERNQSEAAAEGRSGAIDPATDQRVR